MQRRVDEWLFAQGVERTRLPAESNLPPLADIQHENRRTIKDVLRRLASIEGISVRGGDGGPLTPEEREEFADQAYAEGITDFDRIDPTNILAWLRRSGRIDGNLPLSGEDLEVAAMGSGPAPTPPPDVPTLTVNGKALPASAADYDQLAEAVQAALSDDFLNSGATYLEVPTVTSGRTRHESGAKQRRGQGGRHRDASDATAWATGYIGEVAANAWLVRRFGTERVRWCSSYRDDHQGGKEGDNSLGYDFEVIDGDRRLYYEVKATKGTETTFELRPVEHRFATDHAGDDSFRILFLTEVLDGTRCRAYELPNPLGREAHRFTLLDSSMRLAFTVHDCDD